MRVVLFCLSLVSATFSPAFAGPLSDSAKLGDVAAIERLIDAGADVNEADSMASALHYAAMRGHAEAVALLASHGAELEAPSKIGTPLQVAAKFGQASVNGGREIEAPLLIANMPRSSHSVAIATAIPVASICSVVSRPTQSPSG